MKVHELLDKLRHVPEIDITEERSLKDSRRVITFFAQKPFPKVGPAWYSLIVHSDDDEVQPETIDAMLRHLWMFQLDIKSD